MDKVRVSKTLSLWLRHKPEAAGLTLSSDGWADLDAVIAALRAGSNPCSWEQLLDVVETNDKQRFELSDDACHIRARQGHSINVDLDWPQAQPPQFLWHGTVGRFLNSIMEKGLLPMSRHHVHLSPNIETAERVGARRGAPVILQVEARRLWTEGQRFFVSGNGVWLTHHVRPDALTLIGDC